MGERDGEDGGEGGTEEEHDDGRAPKQEAMAEIQLWRKKLGEERPSEGKLCRKDAECRLIGWH